VIDCANGKLDRLCKCGHRRGAHVDAYQTCDNCDCRAYDGVIDEIPAGYELPPGVWF
jgi:hypothetical protein